MFSSKTPRDELREMQKRNKVELEVLKAISLPILEGDTPEYLKIRIRLTLQTKLFVDKARNYFTSIAASADMDEAERLYHECQEAYEYLQLLTAGIDTFIAAHPAPKLD